MIYYKISKIYPKNLSQAADEILGRYSKNIPKKNRTGGSRIDIFWCSPTSSTSGGGRLSQGRKEKFVTRLVFRLARRQGRNEEAVTSLKAYRVEFIAPLTEYPGTDNGRGEHQNALVMP